MAYRVIAACISVLLLTAYPSWTQTPVPGAIKHAVQIRDTMYLSIFPRVDDTAGFTLLIDGRELRIQQDSVRQKRSRVILFVVDVSKSMTSESMHHAQEMLTTVSRNADSATMLGIATIGDSASILAFPSVDHVRTLGLVDSLEAKANNTSLREGLLQIVSWLRDQDPLPAERSIVLCSDGAEDISYGLTTDELYDGLTNHGIPVFVLPVNRPSRETEEELARIARASGGDVLPGPPSPADSTAATLMQTLNMTTHFHVILPASICDGGTHTIELVISEQNDERRVRRAVTIGAVLESDDALPSWALYAAIAAIIILVALILYQIRRIKARKNLNESNVHPSEENKLIAQNTVDNPSSRIRITLHRIGRNEKDTITWTGNKGEVIAGRHEDCDIVFPGDDHISSRHCRFTIDSNGVFLSDLDSMNGTYVNGIRITSHYLLSSEDVIQLGKSEYRIQFEGVS